MAKQGQLKRLWNWVKPDSLKTVILMLASVVTALSGALLLYKYFYYDSAAYEPRANVSSTLEWRPSSLTKRCEAVFNVQIENNGAATFYISEIHVRVLEFDPLGSDNSKAAYLSLDRMQQGKVLFDSHDPLFKPAFEATKTPFVGPYPIGGKFHRSFQWLIERNGISNVFFHTAFTLKGENEPRWFTAAWGPTCGDVSQSPTPSPTPSPSK